MYDAGFLERLATGLRMALPQWGLAPDTPLALLTVSENATFAAEVADGKRIVFRVHRPGYHTLAEIRSELAWLDALCAARVASVFAALPLANGDLVGSLDDGGTPRHVVAFPFLPGREPEPGRGLARWYHVLGSVTARLHGHARSWRRPEGFRRKAWDHLAMVGPEAHWGDWRAALGLDNAGRAVLARTQVQLAADVGAYGAGPETFGLVHCDLRPANLLVDGDRLAVIDFDDCGFSWFMFDFAAAVSFMEHEPFIPELEAAWLDGYAAVAPVTAADVAILPSLQMLRRMQLTAWLASHAETPTGQAMGPAFTDGTVALAERYLTARRRGRA